MLNRRDRVPPGQTTGRWLRAAGYLGITIAGIALILVDGFPFWYTIMGYWCLVGGAFSCLGKVTGRWAGEFIGLPLVGSAMIAFALMTYRDAWDAEQWIAVPSIALLAAYGSILLGRWADVAAIGRAARERGR